MILLDFFEILLKFRWNFWKFHGNPLNLQISMNFRGCRDKTRTQMREETQRRPVCPAPTWRRGFGGRKRTLPRRGGEGKKNVIEAVAGPFCLQKQSEGSGLLSAHRWLRVHPQRQRAEELVS